jgi:iron(III) transport system permease protein
MSRAGTRALMAAVLGLLVLFVAYPLAQVALACVTTRDGAFTLDHLAELVTKRHFLRPIANSLFLAALVATTGTVAGFALAFTTARTDLPLRGLLAKVVKLPIISPPFVIALSAILLFGRNGFVTRRILLDLLGVNLYAHGFDIYGLGGLTLVETLSYFPTAYLLLRAVLGSIDPSLEEAAMSLGADRWTTFRRVTLPLTAPALFAAFLLIFIESLADFGNPLTLGGRFNVLSVQAYLMITGSDDLAGGSTLALALLVPSVAIYLAQSYVLERRSFVTITGKPARPGRISVGPMGRAILGASATVTTLVIATFYGLVVFGSFVRLWGVDSTLTLENYANAFRLSRNDVVDSLILAGISSPLSALVSIAVAWLLERRRFFGRRAIDVLSLLTFAVPGTVVGVGYALAFSRPPLVLTGTASIVIALLTFRNMPVGLKAASSALKQIDVRIEEAAANLGAPPLTAFVRVTLPLLAPAISSALTYSFVRAITSVSAVIFVVSGSWNLLTVAILGYVDSSNLSQAAALSVILVAIVLGAFELMRIAMQRLFPGRPLEI